MMSETLAISPVIVESGTCTRQHLLLGGTILPGCCCDQLSPSSHSSALGLCHAFKSNLISALRPNAASSIDSPKPGELGTLTRPSLIW
jgi:hypothetical protein